MRAPALFLVLAVLGSGCATEPQGHPGPTAPATEPWFRFSAPLAVTPVPDGVGSEPSLLAAKDGSLYVVSVLGSRDARGDGLWRSTDTGATWTYLGKPDYPFGGGDADLDEDDAGTLYLPGQWRQAPPEQSPFQPYIAAGESMAVSKDHGKTWSVFPFASNTPVVDRQWTATYKTGNVWLAFNQASAGLVVTKSTDSGQTWTPSKVVPGTSDPGDGVFVAGGPNGIPGDWVVDPNDGTLYLPYAPGIGGGSPEHRLFISRDGGANFDAKVIRRAPGGEQAGAIFGSLARGTAGTLYYAWSESVHQRKGMGIFYTYSQDKGATWHEAVQVTDSKTTAVFPWIVAGGAGKVAIAYYATSHEPDKGFLSDNAPAGQEWFATVAMSRNALADNATFETARLSNTTNHKGPLCTGGTGCDPKNRRLGDFFEAARMPGGRVAIVWVDDTAEARAQYVSIQQTPTDGLF